jgi:hypothetical protein
MLRGEELYQALDATHPLSNGLACPRERYCFETFPHAVTWHLRGGNANARQKRTERIELLRAAGIQLPVPAGIDIIDAALSALTAHLVANGGESLCYGEAQSGFIIVPRATPRLNIKRNLHGHANKVICNTAMSLGFITQLIAYLC